MNKPYRGTDRLCDLPDGNRLAFSELTPDQHFSRSVMLIERSLRQALFGIEEASQHADRSFTLREEISNGEIVRGDPHISREWVAAITANPWLGMTEHHLRVMVAALDVYATSSKRKQKGIGAAAVAADLASEIERELARRSAEETPAP